jgi:predicted small metal-binding protein
MDCDFVARGETEEEVLKLAAEHAGPVYGMTEMSDELVAKVRAAIQDE